MCKDTNINFMFSCGSFLTLQSFHFILFLKMVLYFVVSRLNINAVLSFTDGRQLRLIYGANFSPQEARWLYVYKILLFVYNT